MDNVEQYYMGLARRVALKSKDPSTKVGAILLSKEGNTLSIGYNDMPKGIDGVFPWGKEGNDPLNKKYLYVVHAECNAFINYNGKREALEDAVMYVTLFPCAECAKQIANYGIKTVYYEEDKYHNEATTEAARRIFDAVGVEYIQVSMEKEQEEEDIVRLSKKKNN